MRFSTIARGGLLLLAFQANITRAGEPATQPATQPVAALPAKEHFDIYLLMGQSNMQGTDKRSLDHQTDHSRVLSLNVDDQWVIAHEPIYKPGGGTGPGVSFAVEMLKADPQVNIGLVSSAIGGSALNRWIKGADLYNAALARAKLAAQSGVIKGILWHQGESDTGKKGLADSYERRLAKALTDFRNDLGQPNLPIVVGQLGPFLETKRFPFVDTVRAAIKDMPTTLPSTGYADSDGLHDKGDQLHFDAAGQEEMGRRYANAMRELQKH